MSEVAITQLLKIADIQKLYKLKCKATIYYWIKKKIFPKPDNYQNGTPYWKQETIQAHINKNASAKK
jgi:predicted DNA-binding transcriptional regulator AlpA